MTQEAVTFRVGPDPFAWKGELDPGVESQPAPYQAFVIRAPVREEGRPPFKPLALVLAGLGDDALAFAVEGRLAFMSRSARSPLHL